MSNEQSETFTMADWKKQIAEKKAEMAEQSQQKKKPTNTAQEKKISRDDL